MPRWFGVALARTKAAIFAPRYGLGLRSPGFAAASAQSSLFVDLNLQWEPGPPGQDYRTASGTVTLFQSNGEFLQLGCTLYCESRHRR